jgi:hypothetical protein
MSDIHPSPMSQENSQSMVDQARSIATRNTQDGLADQAGAYLLRFFPTVFSADASF